VLPGEDKMKHLEQIRQDIREFKASNGLDTVVVLWTANTERFASVQSGVNDTADNLMAAISANEPEVAPSTVFAVASILEGCTYINGSPQNTFVPGVIELSELLQHAGPEASDSVVFACELEAAEAPYILMPYLQEAGAALSAHPQLAYRIHVYSDQPFLLGTPEEGKGAECGGPSCDYDCKNCPMYGVYERLKRMEVGLDRQLKYLANLAPIEDVPPALTSKP